MRISDWSSDVCSSDLFGVLASQSLAEWRRKGWIHPDDPRGWFQWYCRYFMGRRHADDERQIKRWRAFSRPRGQIRRNCEQGDPFCRPRQRQALLQWAYNRRLKEGESVSDCLLSLFLRADSVFGRALGRARELQ